MFFARTTMMGAPKKTMSFTFSGTTKPAGLTDIALTTGAGGTTVASGILREGNSSTSNGTYFTLTQWGFQMETPIYISTVTNGGLSSTDRGIGAAMSDATGSKVIYCLFHGNSQPAAIETHISGVRASRATLSGNFIAAGNTISLVPSVSGGIYTYTVHKNGSPIALSWTDSGGLIGTPGPYPGAVFKHIYSGGQFGSPGVSGYNVADR